MSLFLLALALQLGGAALGAGLSARPALALRIWAAGAVAGGAAGLAAALIVLLSGTEGWELTLPWAVPGGSLTLGIDPLSAAFLVPVFALSALFAVYGVGYLSSYAGKRPLAGQLLFYGFLCGSMELVVAARDGLLFLVAWESMSLSSFFLVAFEDDKPDVRDASRVYLVATHLGAAVLLLLFALLGREGGSLRFGILAGKVFDPTTATVLFALALVGFGTKAGFWPLHVWLPKAHPAAPSHVSALMSGVMIKTGVYGLCRVLTLLGPPRAAWGLALLAIGAVSGVLGVLYALAQHDLKALLAYHSEENIGIIALGLGIGILGASHGSPIVAAAGFAGALLHVWNHGIFKGLLFLGAGSVLQATGTRDLERLGGLWRRMPVTAPAFLIGAAAISGLPPLNGLVSEWLIFAGFFRGGIYLPGTLGLASLLGAAVLALVGALALACFAKAVGVVFLGEPRSEAAARAGEAAASMRVPMQFLAFLCLAVGVVPPIFVRLLEGAVSALLPPTAGLGEAFRDLTAWTGPLGALGLVSAGACVLALAVLGLRWALLAQRPVGSSPTWDCGYAAPTARMQYTASSFAEPLTTLFRSLLGTRVRVVPPAGYFPAAGSYESHPEDSADRALWAPLFRVCGDALNRLRFLQQGQVQSYLVYILATLVALLVWALLT